MEKAFKGLAAAVFRDNAWSKLLRANLLPGRIDLRSAPHSSRFRAPELRFAERTTEGKDMYNHFQITADISTFQEWREQIKLRKELGGNLPVITTFKVRVGGTKEEVEAALETAGREVTRQEESASPSPKT